MGSRSFALSKRSKSVLAVLAVTIMVFSVIPLISSEVSGVLETYQKEITYNSNNGEGKSRTIVYDGIASTEYNPEFWEGTGHVPSALTVYLRMVDSSTGDLLERDDKQLYEALLPGTDIGNLDVYVNVGGTMELYGGGDIGGRTAYYNSGGTMVAYDPFVNGSSNNWKGETVQITGIQMTGITIKKNVGTVALSESLTITNVSNNNVTYSDNTITYNGGTDLTDVTITVTLTTNKVFAGWKAVSSNNKYLPGDVILPGDVSFNAQWITPDIFYLNGAVINKTSNTVYCEPYYYTQSTGSNNDNHIDYNKGYTVIRGDDRVGDSMYGTIYKIKAGNCPLSSSSNYLHTGTYRSFDTNNKATLNIGSNNALLDGDVIIDDVHLDSGKGNKHNAINSAIFANGYVLIMGVGLDDPNLTTSISLSDQNGAHAPSVYGGQLNTSLTRYMTSENIQFFESKKRMVFTEQYNGSYTGDYYISTCIIIHSGIYKVVAGGGSNAAIGTSSESADDWRSTYLVLRGGSVGDALYGGSTGGNGYVYADKKTDNVPIEDARRGGTFAYALGHFFMGGDDWQDKMTGNLYRIAGRDKYNVLENTIASASGHSKDTMGASHLFVSDNASLWVVNGANREHGGYTRVSVLDISGSAVIRHVAAGTTANAKKEDTKSGNKLTGNVKAVQLRVRDNATVALVLGGGYDIWQNPTASTIVEGYIDVKIAGGTVGNVYGGGYRGSVGDHTDNTRLDVTVTVSGGVVLGNVYGGGSGGTDRGQHKPDGTWGRGGETTMSEGTSRVYGDVIVNVTGGTVNGNVYGGGMSVPVLQSYTVGGSYQDPDDTEKTDGKSIGGLRVKIGDEYRAATKEEVHNGTQMYNESGSAVQLADSNKAKVLYVWDDVKGDYYAATNQQLDDETGLKIFKGSNVEKLTSAPSNSNYVAAVIGTTTVNVSGGNILGSVYGGGEGISMTKVGSNNCIITKDYSRVTVVKTFSDQPVTIDTLPWFADGEPIYRTVNAYNIYLNYARVGPDSYDSKTYATVNITESAHISGGVFGGGCSGFVNGNRMVTLDCDSTAQDQDYNVDNSVYGGSSTGNDTGNSIVCVTSGKVKNSVFGGGFMGTTDGETNICIGYYVNNIGMVDRQNEGVQPKPSIYIGDSVYAGADVKEGFGTPYSQALVTGEGHVYVYGRYTDIAICGAIMGDGNSCLTNGWKEILIEYFTSNQELTGIHRANLVTIVSSKISISGREARVYDKVTISKIGYKTGVDTYVEINGTSDPNYNNFKTQLNNDNVYYTTTVDPSTWVKLDRDSVYEYVSGGYDFDSNYPGNKNTVPNRTDYKQLDRSSNDFASKLAVHNNILVPDTTGSNQLIKMASLFRIGKVVLQNGSIISIQNPAEDIRSYESVNINGNPTTYIAPMNKIEFAYGGSFYVRKEMSSVVSNYGVVRGYTQIGLSEQGSYGAYVFGNTSSPGGFVKSEDGRYVYTNTADFAGDVRSWYIAGVENKVITMSLTSTGNEGDINSVTSVLNITKLQSNTDITYKVGGYFPSHSGFTFISPSISYDTSPERQYSLAFGNPGEISQKAISFDGVYLQIDSKYAYHYIDGSYVRITSANFDYKKAVFFGTFDEPTQQQLSDAEVIKYVADGTNFAPAAANAENKKVANLQAAMVCNYSDNKYSLVENYGSISVSSKGLVLDGRYLVNGNDVENGWCYRVMGDESKGFYSYEPGNGVYNLNLEFKGKSTPTTEYLGYVTLQFVETELVNCKVGDVYEDRLITVNTVEIRVDLYVEGYSSSDIENYDLSMDAVYDESSVTYTGSSDILVMPSGNGDTLYVTALYGYRVAGQGDVAPFYSLVDGEFVEYVNGTKYVSTDDLPGLTLSAIGNVNNTNGWLEAYSRNVAVGGSQQIIGVLSGGYYGTLRMAIDSDGVYEGLSYELTCEVRDGNGAVKKTINITITITFRGFVTVTFYDERFDKVTDSSQTTDSVVLYASLNTPADLQQIKTGENLYADLSCETPASPEQIKKALFYNDGSGFKQAVTAGERSGTVYLYKDGTTIKQFRYGSKITANDCPPATSNFAGWYVGPNENDPLFNFNTVIITDLSLYAKHSITVTYDYQTGIATTTSLGDPVGGADVPIPVINPTRNGYVFGEFQQATAQQMQDAVVIYYGTGHQKIATIEQIRAGTNLYLYDDSEPTDEQIEGAVFLINGLQATDVQRVAAKVIYYGQQDTPATYSQIIAGSNLYYKNNNQEYVAIDDPITEDYTVFRITVDWYVDKARTQAWDGEKAYNDLTLYAKWTGKPVKVIFKNNDQQIGSAYYMEYGTQFGSTILSAKAQGIEGFQYWKYGDETAIYFHTILDEMVVSYSGDSLTIELNAVAVAPGATAITIHLENDPSKEGSPSNEKVIIEGHGNETYISEFKSNPLNQYDKYYTTADVSTWSKITTLQPYAILESDSSHVLRNGPGYLIDDESVVWQIKENKGTLRIYYNETSHGLYYYDNETSGYVAVSSRTYDPDNLYANMDDTYYKVVGIYTRNTDYTVYAYSFTVNATAPGYDHVGWQYGSCDQVSYTHVLGAWVKDSKIYDIYIDELYASPMVHYDNGITFDSCTLNFDACWNQVDYIVRLSNNAHGYMIASKTLGGPSLGNEFTAKYGEIIYLRFEGHDGYVFSKWISTEGCTIDNATASSTYITVSGDCGITANMTLDQSIVILNLTFEESGKTLDKNLRVYLVSNGEYIEMSPNGDITAEKYSYIGIAGNGHYGVCIFDGVSYYLVKNITINDNGSSGIPVENIELIYLLTEEIHSVDNMYDLTAEDLPSVSSLDCAYGDPDSMVLIVGGYGYDDNSTIDGTGGVSFVDPNLIRIIGVGSGNINIVINESEIKYFDGSSITKIIPYGVDKRVIYIIAKSDWITQGGTWDIPAREYEIINGYGDIYEMISVTMERNSRPSTSTPGVYPNKISSYDCGPMASYFNVYCFDGTYIIVRANTSIVTADVIGVNELSIVTLPTKVVYLVDEQLDLTGLEVRFVYSDGTYGEVITYNQQTAANFRIEGFDSSEVTNGLVVTVYYRGVKATFTVDIVESVGAQIASPLSIEEVSKMAMAESANNVIALVNFTMGRRL